MVMPILSWAQRRTGRRLGSATVVADSSQTLLCTYLSAVLLAGLALNAAFGWWWADAVVGLVVAGLALREGREAWRGEACICVPVVEDSAVEDSAVPDGCSGGSGCGAQGVGGSDYRSLGRPASDGFASPGHREGGGRSVR
jgi:hypothetical protein